MYDILPSFILGFHGCDESVAEAVFAGKTRLKRSQNEFDWLGHGIYFWENNPQRALAYAKQLRDRPRRGGAAISRQAVVVAVIDLGRCLNLLSHEMIALVKGAHTELMNVLDVAGKKLPVNVGGNDLLQRYLDCAVLQHLHTTRRRAKAPAFDTVRGVFVEGSPIYPDAGFHEKSHIQLRRRPTLHQGLFSRAR